MSESLPAVRRHLESLRADRERELQEVAARFDQEIRDYEITEAALLRLPPEEPENGQCEVADASDSPTDLEGRSAPEAAHFVLIHSDPRREGMHFSAILDHAVRLGYRRGDPNPSRDTMRRGLAKRGDLFEPLGNGVFRLRSEEE